MEDETERITSEDLRSTLMGMLTYRQHVKTTKVQERPVSLDTKAEAAKTTEHFHLFLCSIIHVWCTVSLSTTYISQTDVTVNSAEAGQIGR